MKALHVAVAIGIAILLPLLAQMTVRFYADPPSFGGYGYYGAYPPDIKTKEQRQQWEAEQGLKQNQYEKAQAEFNLLSFYFEYPLGIVEILAAFAIRRRTTLAAGMLFGGLSTVATGSFASWETLPGIWRYLSLLFLLLLLGMLAVLLDRSAGAPSGMNSADRGAE